MRSARCFLSTALFAVLTFVSSGATEWPDDLPSLEQRYLRHPLIFLESPPQVFLDRIVFTSACLCRPVPEGATHDLSHAAPILRRGQPVRVVSRDRAAQRQRLEIESEGKRYELALAGVTSWERRGAFDLLFAKHPPPDATFRDDIKTRSDVVDYLGFPISTCRKGTEEYWFYFLGFAAHDWGAYDEWCIHLKDGHVVGSEGSI
jgi:hypothetical protein